MLVNSSKMLLLNGHQTVNMMTHIIICCETLAEHKGKAPVSLAMDPSPSVIEMTFLTIVVSKAAIVWILTLLYVLSYPRAHCTLYFQCSQYILLLAFNSTFRLNDFELQDSL